MEIEGTITQILAARNGISKNSGSPWVAQQYVLKTKDARPKSIVFEVFGEDKIKEMNIQIGETLSVFFDIDAREFQGRWFNQLRAWKVNRKSGLSVADPEVGSDNLDNTSGTVALSDLPFDSMDVLPF